MLSEESSTFQLMCSLSAPYQVGEPEKFSPSIPKGWHILPAHSKPLVSSRLGQTHQWRAHPSLQPSKSLGDNSRNQTHP